MSRLTEIYEGWKNVVFPTPDIRQLAEERIKICIECDKLNALNICSLCCCPHVGKAHSPSSRCPANKWPDGWGKEPKKITVEPTVEQEIEVMLWDGEEWVSSFEVKKMIDKKSDPLYVFESQEEAEKFHQLKMNYGK